MAPFSAKAKIIHEWQKVEQRKMKKTTKKTKKNQESAGLTTPSKTHYHHEVAGDDHSMKKEEEEDISSSGGCCTPKAERFKIPEIISCPPAPKKKMVFRNYSSNNIRSPIPFFSSPDIDFFFSSLRNL